MEDRENNIERLIKGHLQGKTSDKEAFPSENCPSELELSDYLENRLSEEKQDLVLEHVSSCSHCLSLLELAQRARVEVGDRPSSEMIMRAKNIAQQKAKKTILEYKWPILAFISFSFSFIFTRYFLQFLVLAVIFSVKWIFDTGSTRTLIMIYEAWRKKDKGTAQRIIKDLQDKIEQRR